MAKTKEDFESRLLSWSGKGSNWSITYLLDGEQKTDKTDTKAKLQTIAKKLGMSLDNTFENKIVK